MDNNQNAVTQTENKTEGTVTESVTKTDNSETKTFTQEEVNAMLAKERKKTPSKEEWDAFKNWQDSQKSVEEKNTEILKENASLKTRVTELENMQVVANAGVDSKFQKFVVSEISKEGDFEDNLKEYLKNNPQYLIKKEDAHKTTGVSQNTNSTGVSEEKAYLDKKYANNPYYKK